MNMARFLCNTYPVIRNDRGKNEAPYFQSGVN